MSNRFRKKPVEIEAFHLNRDSVSSIKTFLRREDNVHIDEANCALHIPTLEGVMLASEGDWLIRGVAGELYPCKAEIFDATYESVA